MEQFSVLVLLGMSLWRAGSVTPVRADLGQAEPALSPAPSLEGQTVTATGVHEETLGGCDFGQGEAKKDADAKAAVLCGGRAMRISAYRIHGRCTYWNGTGKDIVSAQYFCGGSW